MVYCWRYKACPLLLILPFRHSKVNILNLRRMGRNGASSLPLESTRQQTNGFKIEGKCCLPMTKLQEATLVDRRFYCRFDMWFQLACCPYRKHPLPLHIDLLTQDFCRRSGDAEPLFHRSLCMPPTVMCTIYENMEAIRANIQSMMNIGNYHTVLFP